MAPTTTSKVKSTKTKSTGRVKKISPYNKFVREELQRLKAEEPSMTHTERFKRAAENWKSSPKNPKNATA